MDGGEGGVNTLSQPTVSQGQFPNLEFSYQRKSHSSGLLQIWLYGQFPLLRDVNVDASVWVFGSRIQQSERPSRVHLGYAIDLYGFAACFVTGIIYTKPL